MNRVLAVRHLFFFRVFRVFRGSFFVSFRMRGVALSGRETVKLKPRSGSVPFDSDPGFPRGRTVGLRSSAQSTGCPEAGGEAEAGSLGFVPQPALRVVRRRAASPRQDRWASFLSPTDRASGSGRV